MAQKEDLSCTEIQILPIISQQLKLKKCSKVR